MTSPQKCMVDKQKHPILPGCVKNKCTKQCHNHFNEQNRLIIHAEYWKCNFNMRRAWLSSKVCQKPIKRRHVDEEISRKNKSIAYTLTNTAGETFPVCQKFFLNTLGYTQDQVIKSLFLSMQAGAKSDAASDSNNNDLNATNQANPCLVSPKDARGKHPSSKKINRKVIIDHIESFNPSLSHFRREHAPFVRYLSSDITVSFMHKHFKDTFPDIPCSYEVYRKTLREMNISFSMPSEDKCSTCLFYEMNMTDDNEEKAKKHNEEQRKARKEYNVDSEKYNNSDDVQLFAVDMQKVLLIPRMPDVKDSFFCSRLVAFNETFASMKNDAHFCVLWNEAIHGRNASDVTSSYIKVMEHLRETQHFIFWADNCTAQNKNWTIFSSFALHVNKPMGPKSITMKFLVAGHTFMAADGIHGKIEQSIRRKKNIYDMRDLIEVVENCTKRTNVLEMKVTDFALHQNLLKRGTRKTSGDIIPNLHDLCEVKFEKGSFEMIYKKDFNESGTKVSFLKTLPENHTSKVLECARGVSKSKLDKIKSTLVSRMPLSRRSFWEDLPNGDHLEDLLKQQ